MGRDDIAIRVVSLRESRERRARMAETLAAQPLPWAFHDGCRATTPCGLTSDPAAQAEAFGRPLTAAEVGCFKSHHTALAAFDEAPELRWLLVLEDDVWLDPAFDVAALVAVLEREGIGYLRLYARSWQRATARASFGERQILFVHSDPYGTQGYLIRRAEAAAFRAHARSVLRPVDDELGRFWEHGIETHMIFPFPMVERAVPSTIAGARDTARGARRRRGLRRRWVKLRDAGRKRAWLMRRRLSRRR